jgi:hypothetical protein
VKLIRHDFAPAANVYFRRIVLLYGSREEINHVLVRVLGADQAIPENMHGRWCRIEDRYRAGDYIAVVRQPTRDLDACILSHELWHHASHTLRHAGIEHTRETEEAYCYYHSWLMEQCLRWMRR